MDLKYHHFPNIGYLEYKFSDQDLLPVKTEVEKIKNNFSKSKASNSNLVGNILKEYAIEESKDYLESLLLPFITKFDQQFDYLRHINCLTGNLPFTLDNVWVNFQKKHEFNPNHNHSGFMSFVIWVDIPFDQEDEMAVSPGRYSTKNFSGNFEFQYTNSLGQISSVSLPVDKKFNNTMILFPSKFIHCVYPFYSSNDFRVSIAGNFYLKS